MKLSLVAFALGLAAFTATAATLSWTNINGGNWNAATNCSPNQVPAATSNVFITADGTYTVTLNVSATISSLTLGGTNGQPTLGISSGTLTLNNSSLVDTNGILMLGGSGVLGGITLCSAAQTWA